MLQVKNWAKFQHYKDRNPPWIKLATDVFQNYEFSCLHDASKLLALCIWTLASRSKEGTLPPDFEWIKRQGNLSDFVKKEHLKELIDKGFIIDTSNVLAESLQDAIPETEAYRKETDLTPLSPKPKKEPKNAKPLTTLEQHLGVNPSIPDDWAYAAATDGFDPQKIATEWLAFCNHHIARANKFVDWKRAWGTWRGNAVKFEARNGGRSSGNGGKIGGNLAAAVAYSVAGRRGVLPSQRPSQDGAGNGGASAEAGEDAGVGVGSDGQREIPF